MKGLSKAVRKVFVELYNQGLIYQGNVHHQLVPRGAIRPWPTWKWSTKSSTATSTISATPLPTAAADGIVVATTRPETMLGDTAVAVHPEDERYAGIYADHVILPLMERKMPIIRDSYVDNQPSAPAGLKSPRPTTPTILKSADGTTCPASRSSATTVP